MKKIVLIAFTFFCALNISAQEATENMGIQVVMNACIALRDAVEAGDTVAIRKSADDLRAAGTVSFVSLRCKDKSVASLDGHLVFDEAFADSLASGNTSVYSKANALHKSSAYRGQTSDGSYLTKTCMVKAGQSTKYTFSSKGHQELAVVAEAGGLVTMKIRVTNSAGLDRRYDDKKNVKTGLPQRKTSFDLPVNRMNIVELEIINCGNKDCSFVVISN